MYFPASSISPTLPLLNTTSTYRPSVTGDAVDRIAATPTPGLFQTGGFFSKLVDTGAAVYLTRAQLAAQRGVNTASQANPVTPTAPNGMSTAGFNLAGYMPFIGGGIALLMVIVIIKSVNK